jgi:GNAT superfamily N-acetyltransferase
MSGEASTDYTLRPAAKADYDFLYRLNELTMRGYVERTWGGWDEALQRAYFRERFEPSQTQIVQAGGRDVGMLSVLDRADEICLNRVQILPDHQGRGLGTSIVRDVLAAANRRGLPVSLRVLKVNPARRLYERLGFTVTGETETHDLMRTG